MGTIRQILAIVDPTTRAQPCVNKAARLAEAFRAELELFICDALSELRATRFTVAHVYEAALDEQRAHHKGQLETLATALRQKGLKVSTDVAFEDSLHEGIVQKVRATGADLVFKDTHYHGPIRRALFTNTDWHLIRECPAPLLLTKPAVWRALVRIAAAVDPGHVDDKPATLDRELLDTTGELASTLHGEARAVHVFNPMPLLAGVAPVGAATGGASFADGELLMRMREVHERDFNALLAAYPAFAGHTDVIDGAPPTVLPDYVLDKEIDVLVMGAVARRALQRLMLGSTAERLLDRLPCDILVLKPRRLFEEMRAVRSAA
jgi:universal stress protein E